MVMVMASHIASLTYIFSRLDGIDIKIVILGILWNCSESEGRLLVHCDLIFTLLIVHDAADDSSNHAAKSRTHSGSST